MFYHHLIEMVGVVGRGLADPTFVRLACNRSGSTKAVGPTCRSLNGRSTRGGIGRTLYQRESTYSSLYPHVSFQSSDIGIHSPVGGGVCAL